MPKVHRMARPVSRVRDLARELTILPLLFAPSSNTFSYMTSAPSAAAAFMLGAIATATIGRAVGTKVPLRNGAAQVGVFVLGAAAIGLSARNVLLNQVVPNWLEYALVRAEIRHHLSSQPISAITIFTRGSLGGQGRYEFSWSNFSAAFWVHWAVRDILDELGADSRIPIDVVATDGDIGKIDEASTDTSRQYLVVDTGFWIFGKKRMLPAGVVRAVDVDEKKVFVAMTKDEIKGAPDYDEEHHKRDEPAYHDEVRGYYDAWGGTPTPEQSGV